MSGCRPTETPIDPNLTFVKEGKLIDRGQYQIDRQVDLSRTRPDIFFAMSLVSQFMHSPREEHQEAVYRIMRYLKSAPGKGPFFKKNEQRSVEAYIDAYWAGSSIDRRSAYVLGWFIH